MIYLILQAGERSQFLDGLLMCEQVGNAAALPSFCYDMVGAMFTLTQAIPAPSRIKVKASFGTPGFFVGVTPTSTFLIS